MEESRVGSLRGKLIWLLLSVFLLSVFCLGLGIAVAQDPPRSPYAGNWEFTFSGQFNGEGHFTVWADGHITGVSRSLQGGGGVVDGTVKDDGFMDWEVPGVEFVGKADGNGNATGTWRKQGYHAAGGWSAKRLDPDAGFRSKKRNK